jgi:diaminohydroxyphosphoribosylaminopyrimidine deaminase / 5-amino-6-(5-phosphoribosylamino)uracil reductase
MTHLLRALDLARGALGSVSPNPPVGAVLVRRGKVVGEGFTRPPGGDHAEVVAIKQAGENAEGADMYVTLEPCSRHGRTPPCTDAIVAAGISRVRVAMVDPNPDENGLGIEQLQQAGLHVEITPYRDEIDSATKLTEAYRKHVASGKPFVISKFAMSLDGKIAAHTGSSTWITGVPSRARAHVLRAECDAVVVGIGTVVADNPRMTARDAAGELKANQPLRVVIDSKGRVPEDAVIVSDGGRTLIACATMDAAKKTMLEQRGVQVEQLPGNDGRVDVSALMALLGSREITSVLVEGGGQVAGSLFDAGLVDKVAAFIAPVIVGGAGAPGPVAGKGVSEIANALHLRDVTWEPVGVDMLVTGYPSIIPHTIDFG